MIYLADQAIHGTFHVGRQNRGSSRDVFFLEKQDDCLAKFGMVFAIIHCLICRTLVTRSTCKQGCVSDIELSALLDQVILYRPYSPLTSIQRVILKIGFPPFGADADDLVLA